MARSIYFEDLLFPLLGKRETEYSNSSINDPIEIEIPDSRAIMLEVIHYIYTGVVSYQKLKKKIENLVIIVFTILIPMTRL